MAKSEALSSVLDKQVTFTIAQELGMEVPRHHSITNINQLEPIENKLSFPVVVKPGRSMGAAFDHRSQLKVEYAFSPADLHNLSGAALKYGEVILQEYVQGTGVGVEVLADKGRILYAFQHERVHEVPLTGGGSSLRKSVDLDPLLYQQTAKLIDRLSWDGVAMVEYKLDRNSGSAHFMEVNGRFWGSLPLAEASGANFPLMLYRYWVNGETDFPQNYSTGVFGRRLTSDIHWHELVLRKAAPKALDVLPTKNDLYDSLRLIFSRRHRFDVQRYTDPLPGIREVIDIFVSYVERLRALLSTRRRLSWQLRRWRTGEVEAALSRAKNIVFVCYGNINRSAIAGLLFDRALPRGSEISQLSFGFHSPGGRSIDSTMCEIAQGDGLSTQKFKSSVLTKEGIAQADLIFVMEQSHYEEIIRDQPWARGYTFLLGGGDCHKSADIEISDPYGQSKQDYILCYNRVKSCVKAIAGKTLTYQKDSPIGPL
nr:ATP-grasp domain-containing protein [Pseudomaricurvus alkylphenolicus]